MSDKMNRPPAPTRPGGDHTKGGYVPPRTINPPVPKAPSNPPNK